MQHDQSVDVRGLCCAEPIFRITKAMQKLRDGQVLLVLADKVSLAKDVPAYCHQTGHELAHRAEEDGTLQFWIRRNPGGSGMGGSSVGRGA